MSLHSDNFVVFTDNVGPIAGGHLVILPESLTPPSSLSSILISYNAVTIDKTKFYFWVCEVDAKGVKIGEMLLIDRKLPKLDRCAWFYLP